MKYNRSKTMLFFTSILLLCAISLSGCTFMIDLSESGIGNTKNNGSKNETAADTKTEEFEEYPDLLEDEGLIYDMLSDLEKNIYTRLYHSVLNGEDECVIQNVIVSQYQNALPKAINAFLYENPEFFYFNGGYSCTKMQTQYGYAETITIRLDKYSFCATPSQQEVMSYNLNRTADAIAEKASKLPTDYEKVLYVHDYIVKNTNYDHEAAKAFSSENMSVEEEMAHTAYGALVRGLAVCDGYSKAFGMLMSKLGIDCMYVTGTGKLMPHAWNCVKIDGDFYYTDITWDDPTSSDRTDTSADNISYTYFALTSEMFEKTHKAEEKYFTYPECTATKYNYYMNNGMHLEKYYFNAFSDAVEAQAGNDRIYIAFSDADEYQKAIKDIITNKKFSSIPSLSGGSIRYSKDDINLVLTVYPTK